MRSELAVSERRACGSMQIHRATYRYAPRAIRLATQSCDLTRQQLGEARPSLADRQLTDCW